MSVAVRRGGGNSGAPIPDLLARTTQAAFQNGNECIECKKKFGIFNWRHHCRCCGGTVCSGCSPTFIEGVPGYSGSERVCNICVANQFLYMVVSHQGVFTGYKQHYYSNLLTARSVYTRIEATCSRVLMHVGTGRIVDSWFARASWEESVMGKAFAYRESLMYPQPTLYWLIDIPMGGGGGGAAAVASASSSSGVNNAMAASSSSTAMAAASSSSTVATTTTTPGGAMTGVTEWYATCTVWRLLDANILSHAFTLSTGVDTIKESSQNTAFIAICNNTRTPSGRDAIEQIGSTPSSKTGIANHISSGYRVVIVAIHRQRREVSGLFTFRYAVYDSLTEAYQAFDSISSWAAVATFGDVIRDSRPLPERATANSSRENENSDEWCLQMVDVSTCDAIAAKGSRKMGDVNRSPNIIYSIVNAFSALPRMTQSGIYIACTMLADEVIVSSEGWSVFMVGIPTHKKKVRLEGEERRLALAARSAAAAASSSSSAVVSGGAAASSSSSSYTEAIIVEQTVERHCKQVGSPSAARNSFFQNGGCIFILPRGADEPFLFRRHPKLSNTELRQLTELATDAAIRHQIEASTSASRNNGGGGEWHQQSNGGPPNYPPPSRFNTTTTTNNNGATAAMASSSSSSPLQSPPNTTTLQQDDQGQPLWSSRGAAYVTRNDLPTPTTSPTTTTTNTTPQSTTTNPASTPTPTIPLVAPPQQQQMPECQICMDEFNSSTRKPCLCGSCGNSLCLECIHSCTTCPLCREPFPDFTVKRPMTNVQLLQLVQEIEDRSK